MFEHALKVIPNLPESQRSDLWARLGDVRDRCNQHLYCGVDEDRDALLLEHGVDD